MAFYHMSVVNAYEVRACYFERGNMGNFHSKLKYVQKAEENRINTGDYPEKYIHSKWGIWLLCHLPFHRNTSPPPLTLHHTIPLSILSHVTTSLGLV